MRTIARQKLVNLKTHLLNKMNLKKVTHYMSFFLIMIIRRIAICLSIKQRMKAGALIGKVLKNISGKRKSFTIDNINKAFPELNELDRNKILDGAYKNLGITFTELLVMDKLSEQELDKYVKYENLEIIDKALAKGKGIIFLSAHYGNWEYLAYTIGRKVKVNVVVKAQRNIILDKEINRIRASKGNKLSDWAKAAKEIIISLKNNEAVAMLVDQAAQENKDIYVDFFGRPALTYESPAYLALRFGAPIIMGLSERLSDGTYIVKLIEVQSSDLKADKEGVLELTKRHVKALENQIRLKPELWAWQHRRWKR